MVEGEHHVTSVRRWLPAGPTDSHGERKDDLIQFISSKGGLRTVRVKDIVDIR
jgi:hypothetical protein